MRRWFYRFSLFSLIGLVLCTVTACGQARSHKYDIVDHPYYQQKVAQFAAENANYADGVDVVFIGDSWTDGYDVVSAYPAWTVLNRGIGGDTSYGLLQRLAVSVYAVQPKVVVLLIGGNNRHDYQDDVRQIVTELQANLPHSQIVMQSTYTIVDPALNRDVQKMCQYFQKLSQELGVTYVDIYSALLDAQGQVITDYHVADGVHMSAAGYAVVTAQLQPVLATLLAE